MRRIGAFVFVFALLLGCVGLNRTSRAIPPFKTEFDELYMREGTPIFAALNGRSNCNVCHLGSFRERQRRNVYGVALSRLLDNRSDARRPARIRWALKTVAGQRYNARDRNSPTFGELIRTGRLPVTR